MGEFRFDGFHRRRTGDNERRRIAFEPRMFRGDKLLILEMGCQGALGVPKRLVGGYPPVLVDIGRRGVEGFRPEAPNRLALRSRP